MKSKIKLFCLLSVISSLVTEARDSYVKSYNATVDVTFQVDMSDLDTHEEGVYLAGGGFGQVGHLMTDDGNDVWSVTLPLPVSQRYLYKFRNQPSYGTWDGFEDESGLIAGACNIGEYNDRYVDVATSDIVLPIVLYGSCTSDSVVSADVTFQVDMSDFDTHEEGVYLAGGGFGQEGHLMTDDGNDVWSVTLPLPVNQRYLYKFRNQPSYGTWDGFENVSGLISGDCVIGAYNDRYVDVATSDIVLPVVPYERCNYDQITTSDVTFRVDMSAVDTNEEGVYLAGGTFGQEGHLMIDDGNDVWSVTLPLAVNQRHLYKYRNQPSYGTWNGFEDVSGGCVHGEYNDRYVDVATPDIVLPVVSYGSCILDEVRILEFTDVEMEIYPNPARHQLRLIVNSNFDQLNMEVVNSLGISLIHKEMKDVPSEYVIEFDIDHLPKEVYVLKISTHGEMVTTIPWMKQ